jgi:hypothetical protein
MTAPLTANEIDHARRIAAKPEYTLAGYLANGEAFYSDGEKFYVEKDYRYLVRPIDAELAEIYRLVKPKTDDLAPARGIMVGMLIGAALWAVIGIIIYFTFFN